MNALISSEHCKRRPSKSLIVIIILVGTLTSLLLFSVAEAETEDVFEWYNTTWQHRVGLEIEVNEDTTNWPIEHELNFTELLENKNTSGTFDVNSIKVIEYDEDGNIIEEVPSQFSEGEGYDPNNNAHGELIFLLDGENEEDSKRYFYIYYDIEENGPKTPQEYEENLEYDFDGEKVNITTEKFEYYIDTEGGDNTSGIYRIYDQNYNINITHAEENDRTAEYIEYSNGTDEFTFDLSGSAEFETGPLRLTMVQQGYPVFYDGSTEESILLEKRYHFYWGTDFFDDESFGFYKIEQEITNVDEEEFILEASPLGAITWDLNRTLYQQEDLIQYDDDFYDYNDPYSFVLGISDDTAYQGLINLPLSNDNFGAASIVSGNNITKIGTNLSQISLEPGETLEHYTFQGSGMGPDAPTYFMNTKDVFEDSPTIHQHEAESYHAEIDTWTNKTTYNRGETIKILSEIVEDYYNLTDSMQVVLNKNTTEPENNITLDMTENETGSNWYAFHTLDQSANLGLWDFNVSVYTEDDIKFGTNVSQFNVTDHLVTNLTLKDDIMYEDGLMEANFSVKNVREDKNITSADIECIYDEDQTVENITEISPGLYNINFTAPYGVDNYTLACEANKDGNTGESEATFLTEVAKLVPVVNFDPASFETGDITYSDGESFPFDLNISNPREGTAYSANISLDSPDVIELDSYQEECGDIEPDEECIRSFDAVIEENAVPGNYSINTTVEWANPDGTYNTTEENLAVEVLENPSLEVIEDKLEIVLAGGFSKNMGNFTIESLGNYKLENISYTCAEGDVCDNFDLVFTPENITEINVSDNHTVDIMASADKELMPGTYEDVLNISSERSYDTLNLTIDVINETDVKTESIPPDKVVADNITLHDSQILDLTANSTNIGNAFAFDVNQSVVSEAGWATSSNMSCAESLNVSESCQNEFNVEVPENTTPGNYTLDIYTEWANPDGTKDVTSHSIQVEVLENPKQSVPEEIIEEYEIPTGYTEHVGNITIDSLGNYKLENISYTCAEGDVCEDFDFSFYPNETASIETNESKTISVNITVPEAQRAGNYSGYLNISSTGGYNLVDVNISVATTRSWQLEPRECLAAADPNQGTLCSPIITNTGNIEVNISVEPEETEYLEADPANFLVDMNETQILDIYYDVGEDFDTTYNASFNISSEKESEFETYKILNTTLYPANPPEIDADVNPDIILQTESTEIIANVTPRTEFPIEEVNATVVRPDDVASTAGMDKINSTDSSSLWNISYHEDFDANASTELRGVYAVNITAVDEVGNINTTALDFSVAAEIHDKLITLREEDVESRYYDQGETGSLYYELKDAQEEGIEGAEVNFTVTNTQGNKIMQEEGTTNEEGIVEPYVNFDLTDDARMGVYGIEASAVWHEEGLERDVDIYSENNFVVKGDYDISWNLDNTMWFNGTNKTIWTTIERNNIPKDVDDMNLSIYYPNGSLFNTSNNTHFIRQEEGVYRMKKHMPNNTVLGDYLAKLEVSDGEWKGIKYDPFRVVREGEFGIVNFDVNTSLKDYEIEQGDHLYFNLTIKKMQGVDTDARVAYWVSDDDQDYYYASEKVFTPVNETINMGRSAFIYSDQPTGNYTLNVEVDPFDGSETFGASETFRVLEGEEPDEPEEIIEEEVVERERTPPPIEEEPDEPIVDISIIDAPQFLNLKRGQADYESIIIGNMGDEDLHEVRINALGIPSGWINVTPQNTSIHVRETKTFTLNIDIPDNAELGEYELNLHVTSDKDSTSRTIDVEIHESIDEKIAADISDVKEALKELYEKVEAAEDVGIDTTPVQEIINEAEGKIESAEENLEEGFSDAALQDITEARILLREASRVLDTFEEPEDEVFRMWLIIIIACVALSVLILLVGYMVKVRHYTPMSGVKEKFSDTMTQLKKKKMKDREKLVKEKNKAKRLINLIEAEHKEGIMNDETYENLKSSAEEKIERINKKLND